MPRRVSMPGADELFRPTATPRRTTAPADAPAEAADAPGTSSSTPKNSGRVKHDEKMTVYVTSEELLALEQWRLSLRGMVGRNVDRGRLVRAAIALALEDLDEHGADSQIARRLGEA